MKTSTPLRIVAAAASMATTYVLFSLVVSLSEPPEPKADMLLAKAQLTVKR